MMNVHQTMYMGGDWPKDCLDVTMIVLPKKNQEMKYSALKFLISYYAFYCMCLRIRRYYDYADR